MKTFHLVNERRKTTIHLETYQSRYEGLEDVIRACVGYLLDKGQVDRVQMMLLSLAIQSQLSPAEKSKRTASQRRQIGRQTKALLQDEEPFK